MTKCKNVDSGLAIFWHSGIKAFRHLLAAHSTAIILSLCRSLSQCKPSLISLACRRPARNSQLVFKSSQPFTFLSHLSHSQLVAYPVLTYPVSNSQLIFSHGGIWRTMHCRLCINCYGTGQWEGMGQHPLPPCHTHSLAGCVTSNAKTTMHCSPGSSMFSAISLLLSSSTSSKLRTLPSIYRLQTHCTEKTKQIFPEMKLRPRSQFCSKIGGPIVGIYKFLIHT